MVQFASNLHNIGKEVGSVRKLAQERLKRSQICLDMNLAEHKPVSFAK